MKIIGKNQLEKWFRAERGRKILILAERASDAVNQERSARSAEEKFEGFIAMKRRGTKVFME